MHFLYNLFVVPIGIRAWLELIHCCQESLCDRMHKVIRLDNNEVRSALSVLLIFKVSMLLRHNHYKLTQSAKNSKVQRPKQLVRTRKL